MNQRVKIADDLRALAEKIESARDDDIDYSLRETQVRTSATVYFDDLGRPTGILGNVHYGDRFQIDLTILDSAKFKTDAG